MNTDHSPLRIAGNRCHAWLAPVLLSLVLLLMGAQWLMQQQASTRLQLQQTGRATATLAGMLAADAARLADSGARLQALLGSQAAGQVQTAPAFLLIVAPDGQVLQQAGTYPAADEPADAPAFTGQWFGERHNVYAGQSYVEYYAPVISNGELLAFAVAAYPAASRLPPWLVLFALASLPLVYAGLSWRSGRLRPDTALPEPDSLQASRDAPAADASVPAVDEGGLAGHGQSRTADTAAPAASSGVVSSRLLARQNDRFVTMLESMPCGVMVMDSRTEVSYVNKKLCRLLNLQAGTVLGSKLSQWRQHDALREMLGSSQILSDSKCHYRRFDVALEETPVSVELCPLHDSSKRMMVLVYEQQTPNTGQAAVSDFVALLAHQLKSPLNTLFMYSDLLQDSQAGTGKQSARAASVIHQESGRMARLIDQLLNISLLDAGGIRPAPRPTDFGKWIHDTVDRCKRRSGCDRVVLDASLPADFPELQLDAPLLQQAVHCLLDNALQYSEADSRVSLTVEQGDHDVRIVITDRGIGIGEHDRNYIFDMFYRSQDKRVRQVAGNGLGLPLAKRIIDSHGGALFFDSAPGRGSVFTIVLGNTPNELEGVA